MSCFSPVALVEHYVHAGADPGCEKFLSLALDHPVPTPFHIYLLMYGMTVALETPVYARYLTRTGHYGLGRAAAFVALMHVASHPFVVYVLPEFLSQAGGVTMGGYALLAELAAVVIEAVFVAVLGRVAWPKALAVSVVANAWSWAVGSWIVDRFVA